MSGRFKDERGRGNPKYGQTGRLPFAWEPYWSLPRLGLAETSLCCDQRCCPGSALLPAGSAWVGGRSQGCQSAVEPGLEVVLIASPKFRGPERSHPATPYYKGRLESAVSLSTPGGRGGPADSSALGALFLPGNMDQNAARAGGKAPGGGGAGGGPEGWRASPEMGWVGVVF